MGTQSLATLPSTVNTSSTGFGFAGSNRNFPGQPEHGSLGVAAFDELPADEHGMEWFADRTAR